jgi:outer membrane protein assembly complex protein YaeT
LQLRDNLELTGDILSYVLLVQGGTIVRWLMMAGISVALCVAPGRAASGSEAHSADREPTAASFAAAAPLIDGIVFTGLRHIAPGAVQAQISTRAGTILDSNKIQRDVKTLGRLGWFGEIAVETKPEEDSTPRASGHEQHVRLVFHLEELPFLVKVEYSGSRLLTTTQIEKILSDQQLTPKLGEPASPADLHHIAKAIESAITELGHPWPHVLIQRDEIPNGTVRVRFQINEGPYLPVGRINFAGYPEFPPKLLRHQMQRTAPGGLFASWRGRGAYTREGFEEDRARLVTYYQNHGYAEARIGAPHVSAYEEKTRHWIPWPHRATERHLAISVPSEAGPYYRTESVTISPELVKASGARARKLLALGKAQADAPYSAKALEDLRHAWVAGVHAKHLRGDMEAGRAIETSRTFDPETRLVQERISFGDSPPSLVRHIEFRGLQRFPDRYLRRRIGLEEGRPFDERALESGLARISKTGYFHPIRKQDIQVRPDDTTRTEDVTIRVSEAGRQRVSFSGGLGQFGSTLGIAYTLFDLLQRDELLSAQIDAGPESLQLVLGLVMEGFLSSRSSLAFSVFDTVLRPRLTKSVKGPFYTSQTEGLNAGWSYAVGKSDSLALNYSLSHSETAYSFALPSSLTGLPSVDLHAKSSSSALELGWIRDTGGEHVTIENSVSGGILGGNENVIRSNEKYARIVPDPILNHENAWAFRTTWSGTGSYQGPMPLHALLFPGDAQVRGLGSGELGPYAVIPSISSSAKQTYSALPAGANVAAAMNAEYRVPLGAGAQAAGFFDLGSGWLLPNWLGKARPTILDSTNGILHGSLGLELRWTVPGVQVPVRAYYAVNVLRLNRRLLLPDGSLFRAHDRLFVFGWALGSLF